MIYKIADPSYNLRKNVIKISKHETSSHRLAKMLLCEELISNGTDFYTEVIFKNKKRADIYIPVLDEAWEVTYSESDSSIELKKENYPCKVKKFSATDILTKWGLM